MTLGGYIPVVITSIREETYGVKTFTIERTDGQQISYRSGQFITLVFSHHGKEERRSFSISSSPVLSDPVSFTVKRVDNGAFSRLLIDRAKQGDILYTTGAGGLFVLPGSTEDFEQVFFFAAGIGITPVFSLLKTLLVTHPDKKATLIYSNRSRDDVVFYNNLRALSRKFEGRFKVEFLYSSSFDLSRARLSKALLPRLLKEYALVPVGKLLFYICGPFSYMRMAILSLEEQGVDNNQIKRENFNTNDRVVTKSTPPDTLLHTVVIRHNGSDQAVRVQYPQSILQAARKQGISLPFSCEVGRCGSCAAVCVQGHVWLSYNEVLTDTDLKQGKILTCVGYPVGGDAVIDV